MYQGNYSAQADLWSVGVITYMLLCSKRPFHNRKREVTIDKIMAGDYGRLEGGPWRRISGEAKEFVRKLLVVDPKDRMTATEGLAHPWLEESFHTKNQIDAAVDESEKETQMAVGASLKNYKNELELKKIALNVRNMVNYRHFHPMPVLPPLNRSLPPRALSNLLHVFFSHHTAHSLQFHQQGDCGAEEYVQSVRHKC